VSISVLANAFYFIAQILIPRALTREEYASFTVSLSFVTLMSFVADLGLLHLHTRMFAEFSERAARGEEDYRGVLFGSALTVRLLLSGIVALLVLLVAPALYTPSSVVNSAILLIGLLVSSRVLIVRAAGESFMRGIGKYYLSASFVLLDAVTLTILLLRPGASLRYVVWAYVLSAVPGSVFLFSTIVLWFRRQRITIRIDPKLMQQMLRVALPLSAGTFFYFLFSEGDKLLLDRLSTPFEVSNFGAVIRLAMGFGLLPVIFGSIIGPEVTKLVLNRDWARSHDLLDYATRLLLVISGALTILLGCFSRVIISTLFSAKYDSAAPALEWSGWMMIPFFAFSFLAEISIAGGHFRVNMIFMGIIMAVTLLADLFLLPTFGATGAIVARLLAYIAGGSYLMTSHKETEYVSRPRLLLAFIKVVFSVALAYTIGVLTSRSLSMPIAAVCAMVAYTVAIQLTGAFHAGDIQSLWKRLRVSP
jgi:O-antigen/teichoic acid export membrane protein